MVLFVSIFLVLCANGSLFVLVVGLKQIALDFGWTRSAPSLAISCLFLGTGVGGIVMGYWFDRSGAGPVTGLGMSMIGVGALLASMFDAQWQLYAIYGVMMGLLGQAAVIGPLVVNVMRWFEHRRGFAVGLLAAGQGIAGTVWPPVFRYFNEAAGLADNLSVVRSLRAAHRVAPLGIPVAEAAEPAGPPRRWRTDSSRRRAIDHGTRPRPLEFEAASGALPCHARVLCAHVDSARALDRARQ